jgi:hypothetical protein
LTLKDLAINKVNIVTKEDNRPFDRLKGSALTRRISSIFSSISEARTGLLIQFFSLVYSNSFFYHYEVDIFNTPGGSVNLRIISPFLISLSA